MEDYGRKKEARDFTDTAISLLGLFE